MARALGWVLRCAAIVALALGLSGCMAALQVGDNSSVTPFAPPAPPRTATAATAEPEPTTEVLATPTQEPTVAQPAPSATVDVALSPEPTASAVAPAPTIGPSALPTLALPTVAPVSNEERWRARQENRQVFPELQRYRTTGSELLWFDPVNQQSLTLGVISGEFVAQASFVLRGPGVEALEVPYQLNQSFGLTALSPAIIERVQAAGYGEWIETYVIVTPNVTPR